jgi:4-diphosphocytidyl-2-C-methyl-D-erythritol kinase
MLAVTGRRSDGFHDLVSLVATVNFGDTLRAEPATGSADELVCDAPGLPTGPDNLVCRAAAAWRAAGGEAPPVRFILEKRTPAGAGMGGGSSDAVAALLCLQKLATTALPTHELAPVAASLGSDCPLFLAGGPVVIRGRGERIEPLPPVEAALLNDLRVLVCRPDFGIDTPWAYGRLAAGAPATYTPAAEAEARLAAWRSGRIHLEELLANSFEQVAFSKYLAFRALADRLRQRCGLQLHLTGSGSACFALLPKDCDAGPAIAQIREAWGQTSFAIETRLQTTAKSN